jgi:uncharacterized delta-60 repeat protein
MAPIRVTIAVAAGGLALLASALPAHAAAGALDPSFGGDGRVETAIRGHSDAGWAVAVQPDGKLVVAGSSKASADFALSDYDIVLARYRPDGTLDSAFGSGGTVVTALSAGDDEVFAVALQPDGKIVVAGRTSNGANLDFVVLRYLSNGSLDSAFGGGDGIVTTPVGSGDDEVFGIALQTDGKIVAAGYTASGGNNNTAVARYLADGSLDTSFGGSGMVTIAQPGDDWASAVAVQADGKLIVAGAASEDGTDLDFAVVRLLSNGSIDSSFAGDGVVTTSFSAQDDRAWSLGSRRTARSSSPGRAGTTATATSRSRAT